MKMLLVSAEPANRQLLIQFIRSVVEEELGEKLMLETVAYAQVPDDQPEEQFDVVVIDALENPIVKKTMETIGAWKTLPLILGYFVGNKPYVASTMIELGAAGCLTVNPSRMAVPMNHILFFREHLQRVVAVV